MEGIGAAQVVYRAEHYRICLRVLYHDEDGISKFLSLSSFSFMFFGS